MKVGVRRLGKLDRWRGKQANPPNRSEAIRMLVERAIDAECSTSCLIGCLKSWIQRPSLLVSQ